MRCSGALPSAGCAPAAKRLSRLTATPTRALGHGTLANTIPRVRFRAPSGGHCTRPGAAGRWRERVQALRFELHSPPHLPGARRWSRRAQHGTSAARTPDWNSGCPAAGASWPLHVRLPLRPQAAPRAHEPGSAPRPAPSACLRGPGGRQYVPCKRRPVRLSAARPAAVHAAAPHGEPRLTVLPRQAGTETAPTICRSPHSPSQCVAAGAPLKVRANPHCLGQQALSPSAPSYHSPPLSAPIP
mmetsp:Transcript_56642/g.171414  ORF Transcript_56642/g.171414 Transcript_56642/m.171414 type:complete len:243 (-) Transcript_56642:29-757(-)